MYYVGVDLGGTNIKVGICDREGNILKKGSIKTGAERPADEIVADMAALTVSLVKEMGISVSDIECAGIATPGTADSSKGVVVYCCNLPFLDYPLAARFAQFSGISKVLIENDANAAAKGESVCGAAKGYKKLHNHNAGHRCGRRYIDRKRRVRRLQLRGGGAGSYSHRLCGHHVRVRPQGLLGAVFVRNRAYTADKG